ncbi:MBL fold metallo-hydrolase [Corynebacterium suicordis]|uniref:MBL fold metallo-hydrolase n=1 Tax=uncultured Corynebacterium sp. TaxID=159447 RepID=UPI0025931AAC|nr:MBL fold metallo-hydrolase [uncultured Corynebacterium sp.]
MCTPLFPSQAEAALAEQLPQPVLIPTTQHIPGTQLWMRAVPMPGEGAMSFVYSLVYFGERGITVVDPGWPDRDDAHGSIVEPLEDFLHQHDASLQDISQVIATHAHPDHLGAAEAVAQAASARLLMSAREWKSIQAAEPRWFFPKNEPDQLLHEGDPIDDFPFEVIHTPGHTDGHICLADREQQILICADQILPTIFPGIGLSVSPPTSNPIADYLNSLVKLAEFDDYRVLPGHGFAFTNLHSRRQQTAQHVLQRAHEVRNILALDGEMSDREVASKITWSMGWERMKTSSMLESALKQTAMYRELAERHDLQKWELQFPA